MYSHKNNILMIRLQSFVVCLFSGGERKNADKKSHIQAKKKAHLK